jgi:hypothetical protein
MSCPGELLKVRKVKNQCYNCFTGTYEKVFKKIVLIGDIKEKSKVSFE